MKRFFERALHLMQRIVRETKNYSKCKAAFGTKVALAAFCDGIIPPGKSRRYIKTISDYIDNFTKDITDAYSNKYDQEINEQPEKCPVWVCWWQGEQSMPELVKLCYTRLKQVIPYDKADLHLITLDNYQKYVNIPEHIEKKFRNGTITMTTMSDVLRFHLLDQYGGYWLDSTVFFTGDIPDEYFSGSFFCQRMVANTEYAKREACGCNWCGFSMAGPRGNIVFRYMKDAFSEWWKTYDMIIDYVLIDYLLLSGYRHVEGIRKTIDKVPDNNEDIFEMYKVLNQPFSEELLYRLTKRNVMHKLTYKMELNKTTEDGDLTLYGYLCDMVYKDVV